MMDTLYRSYRMLLSNISTEFIRYLHDEIEWSSRLIAILGPRGVGKTGRAVVAQRRLAGGHGDAVHGQGAARGH